MTNIKREYIDLNWRIEDGEGGPVLQRKQQLEARFPELIRYYEEIEMLERALKLGFDKMYPDTK